MGRVLPSRNVFFLPRVCVLPGFAWGAGAGRAASGAALGVESDDSSGMYNVTVKLWLGVQLSKP